MTESLLCARPGCEEPFEPKTHNQKYHNDECCRLATNSRLTDKYHAKKARRKGEVRVCDVCATTKLSRYNDDTTCAACKAQIEKDVNNSLFSMLSNTVLAD